MNFFYCHSILVWLVAIGVSFSFANEIVAQGSQIYDHSDASSSMYRDNPISPTLSILRDNKVQRDLEIVDSQTSLISDLQQDYFAEVGRRAQKFQNLRQVLPPEELEQATLQFQNDMKAMVVNLETEAGNILLPHQQERLGQLLLRKKMQRMGVHRVLSDTKVADVLGLSKSQQKELLEVSEKAKQDLEKKIKMAQREAVDRILKVLEPEQRRAFDKMIGGPLIVDEVVPPNRK